jgi:hypothetical protein
MVLWNTNVLEAMSVMVLRETGRRIYGELLANKDNSIYASHNRIRNVGGRSTNMYAANNRTI